MMPLGGLWRSGRVEVAALREELEDLRAEVKELRRQFRALQEREAILNAQVLHLARYTSGSPAQNAIGSGQGSIPGGLQSAVGVSSFGEEKGTG